MEWNTTKHTAMIMEYYYLEVSTIQGHHWNCGSVPCCFFHSIAPLSGMLRTEIILKDLKDLAPIKEESFACFNVTWKF